MELITTYPAAVNSKATVTMGVLDQATTIVEVLDATVLPEAPNLLVLGTDQTAETVLMTARENNTLTIQRAVQGIAKSWPAGTQIARNFTGKDWDDMRSNVEGINTELIKTTALVNGMKQYKALSELSASETTALLTIFAAMDTPSRLVCDITAGSTSVYPASAGVLMITKTGADTGTATFVYDDGKIATAQFTANSSSGGVNQSDWNRLTDRVETMCNPNLLINPDFKINQRGQSEYSGVGYTVDMWKIRFSGCKVSVTDDYVSIVQNGSQARIQQIIEGSERLSGKVCTLSFLVKGDGTNIPKISLQNGDEDIFLHSASQATEYEIVTKTVLLPEDITELRAVVYVSKNEEFPATAYIKAAKLEIGEFSTLANEVVDHAAELRKCQRYLQVLGKNYSTFLRADDIASNVIYFSVPITETFRTNPSIISYNMLDVKNMTSAEQEGFTFTCSANNEILRINAAKSGHGLDDAYLNLSKVLISAEL